MKLQFFSIYFWCFFFYTEIINQLKWQNDIIKLKWIFENWVQHLGFSQNKKKANEPIWHCEQKTRCVSNICEWETIVVKPNSECDWKVEKRIEKKLTAEPETEKSLFYRSLCVNRVSSTIIHERNPSCRKKFKEEYWNYVNCVLFISRKVFCSFKKNRRIHWES